MSVWRSGRRACDALAELRSAYVDQALDPADRERLLHHLATCGFCRAEVGELRRLRELLGRVPRRIADAPPPLAGSLVAIAGAGAHEPLWTRPFHRGPVGRLPRRRRRARWATAAGTLVLGGVVVGLGIAAAPAPVTAVPDPSARARAEFAAVTAQLPLASAPIAAVMMSSDTLRGSAAHGPVVQHPLGGLELDREAALAVLRRAVQAANSVSYTGRQTFVARVDETTVRATVQTRNRAGRGSVLQVFDESGQPASSTYLPATARTRLTDATQAALLAENYALSGWTGDSIAGRAATVVEAAHGPSAAHAPATTAPAARWWVDDATGLLLRFDTYDVQGRAVITAGFTEIAVREPRPADHVPPRMVAPMTTTSLTLSARTALQDRGWACPDRVAGLNLVRLRTDVDDNPSVLHMAYSDGLSTVSVFEQRGALVERPPGQWDERLGAYRQPGTPSLATWESEGRVFTVVTDGPGDLLAAVVRALPHEGAAPQTTMERVQAGWARILELVTG